MSYNSIFKRRTSNQSKIWNEELSHQNCGYLEQQQQARQYEERDSHLDYKWMHDDGTRGHDLVPVQRKQHRGREYERKRQHVENCRGELIVEAIYAE